MVTALALAVALFFTQDVAEPCESYQALECTAQQVEAAKTTLGLPDIHIEQAAGVEIYRAFLDAGTSFPAVSFEWRPGRSPELVVYGPDNRQLRRDISVEVWGKVQNGSRYAGRKLVSNGTIIDCIFFSIATVEVARQADRRYSTADWVRYSGGLREMHLQASESTCGGGLTSDYAELLMDLGCEEMPECDAMGDREQSQIAAQNLAAVFMLTGDKVSAARLYAQKEWPPSRSGRADPVSAATWSRWNNVQYGATLQWGDQTVSATRRYDDPSPDPISVFLNQQDIALGGFRVEAKTVGGEGSERAWIEGRVIYSRQVNGVWERMAAPYRQLWERHGDSWRLWSWTVEDFTPVPAGID